MSRRTTPESFCQDANGEGICARADTGENVTGSKAKIKANLAFGIPNVVIFGSFDESGTVSAGNSNNGSGRSRFRTKKPDSTCAAAFADRG